MAAKKAAKKKANRKQTTGAAPKVRERFAGYPYAEAYEIQYNFLLNDKGRKQYKMVNPRAVFVLDEKGKRIPTLDKDGKQQLDARGKPLFEKRKPKPVFRRDKKGQKIPILDMDSPIMEEGKTELDKKSGKKVKVPPQPLLKKAKSSAQLPWGFIVQDTGVRKTWRENGKDVAYAACHRQKRGKFQTGEPVWIREDQLQDNRCLEVVFVDIGQGDGCFLVTPENKKMVIDAGQFSNMRHYLHWRYGSDAKRNETTFEAAIISHPDADHYMGFEKLFERDNFYFETVYTNGLMEYLETKAEKDKWTKSGKSRYTSLGPVQKVRGENLVTKLVTNKDELETFLADTKKWSNKTVKRKGNSERKKDGKQFPTMLNEAFNGWKVKTVDGEEVEFVDEKKGTMGDFRMLSVEDAYMPGYGYAKDKNKPDQDSLNKAKPQKTFPVLDENGNVTGKRELSIKVLGPVTQTYKGRPALEYFESNISKTKNGHSVVLRLQYGEVSMLLGGDLNIPSEHLLMSHHTGMKSPPDLEHESAFVEAAREVFQVDIAKSCHHGSSDFTHFFLRALNPIATVISSGDKEPHSHPRSDTLGAIGNHSRSNPRPLIFSTELARSAEDNLQKPHELRKSISDSVDRMVSKLIKAKVRKTRGEDATDREKKLRKAQHNLKASVMDDLKRKLVGDISRSVAVYGAITVVTNGEKVIIYQKLEKKGSHGEYDIYRLEPSGKDKKGPLMYQSKH